MSDLADFLLARVTETEQLVAAGPSYARTVLDLDGMRWDGIYGDLLAVPPAHVLAGCEAKRRIVECAEVAHERAKVGPSEGDGAWFLVLRYLALPYADHPDYREEWRPNGG